MAYSVAALVHIFLLINLIAVGALVLHLARAEGGGRIQDRLGPTRVGGKFGWLQTLADGLKLITKEDLMPEGADEFLFKIAPYVSFCASFAALIALPFAGGDMPFVAQHLNIGVFFIIAVLGLEVFGVILAGYSSASKWSLFGAMREAAQVVSYEVPLGLCAVVPVLIAGSMDLVYIGDSQAGWFTNWFIFHDPFTFIVFWVYFTCATASVNRAPFDLAEAESELVAGFHTEYSGLRWSFFFMAEYGSMMAVSLLASILFLGGWHGPIPIGELAGADVRTRAGVGLPRQRAGLRQHHSQGCGRRDGDDVGSLDAAAAADRPGDHDVLEILRADRGRVLSGCDLVAIHVAQWLRFLRRRVAVYELRENWPARPPAGESAGDGDRDRGIELREGPSDGRDSLLADRVLLALWRDRLRVRDCGGPEREHRADGVLPGALAGGDGGPVLPGRGRFRRCDATVDLRRRHAGAAWSSA